MSDQMKEKNFTKIYFLEARDLLDSMDSSLLELEKNDDDTDSINAVFRSVHTIKGNSSMFGFDRIGDFAHVLENLLSSVRSGEMKISPDLSVLLFECHDFLLMLLDHYELKADAELDEDMNSQFSGLIDRLNSYRNGSDCPAEYTDNDTIEETGSVLNDCWHISIRFSRDVFKNGLDPYPFIKYLSELGTIVNMKCISSTIPAGEEMDPTLCYLGFEMDFRSSKSKKEIEDAFSFILDDCELRILSPKTSINDYVKLIEELPETPMMIGDMLREIGSLTQLELDRALQLQKKLSKGENITGEESLVGSIMLQEQMITKPVLDAVLQKQKISSIRKRDESKDKMIRIDAEKLDHLINLIGELVITGSNVKQIAVSDEQTGLVKAVTDMSKLIEEIRDCTMGIRMVQIGETFHRFERVVHDLSREKDKNVDLVIHGGETELDKTLVDKISDPLIHLIRNAIDHGIDLPEKRQMLGKTSTGTLTLNAYHETGSIVIEVKDDGSGLNNQAIYNKALELGLIKPEQPVTEYEIQQYIFQPGFSTATEISNISGRGVGMDVVKKNIEALRGTVMLESEEGYGTTVRIHLPLTLAIIDGFMIKLADSYYVIPLDMVIECTEIHNDDLQLKEGGNYINLRGDVLPFMKMRDFFNETGEAPQKSKIVVVEHARKKVGLVVDDLIGEFQTVIKPLGRIFSRLQWMSGSTILGTGEVAYILDIPKLIQNEQVLETSEIIQ